VDGRAADERGRVRAERVTGHADVPEIELAGELRSEAADLCQRVEDER
jgi:hypothetical protein